MLTALRARISVPLIKLPLSRTMLQSAGDVGISKQRLHEILFVSATDAQDAARPGTGDALPASLQSVAGVHAFSSTNARVAVAAADMEDQRRFRCGMPTRNILVFLPTLAQRLSGENLAAERLNMS